LQGDEPSESVKESGVIEYWTGKCGSCGRDCGCALFVKTNKHYELLLNVGDRVEFQVCFSDYKGQFIGVIEDPS
jgi:hypothetical protein